MIDIGNLYERFNSMYNTHQAGFYRPVRDFVPAIHEISLEIFNTLGKRLQKDQFTTDMLNPFIKGMNISIEKGPSFDYASTPADHVYYSSSHILMEDGSFCGEKECDLLKDGQCIPYQDVDPGFFTTTSEFKSIPVKLIQDSKWNDVTTHPNRKPKLGSSAKDSRLFCRQIVVNDKIAFEVLPKNVGVFVLHYYRLPKHPVYAYREKVDGPDVYLEYIKDQSRQLEWSEAMIPVFLYKMGKRYGLVTKEPLSIQVGEMDKELL